MIICGDFNFPTIDWKEQSVNDTPYSPAMRFYTCLQDNFLIQHVKDPTRVRGNDEPSLLDLIITEDLQTQVSPSLHIDPPLKSSDHAVLKWDYLVTIKCETENNEDDKTAVRYNYFKGDYSKFKTMCSKIEWDTLLT